MTNITEPSVYESNTLAIYYIFILFYSLDPFTKLASRYYVSLQSSQESRKPRSTMSKVCPMFLPFLKEDRKARTVTVSSIIPTGFPVVLHLVVLWGCIFNYELSSDFMCLWSYYHSYFLIILINRVI